MASSVGFHEEPSDLAPATRDRHRALASLQEEFEAVDWYDQRIDAAGDSELAAILAHNRDEEKEHAAMTLEWLRRHDAALDDVLRRYLFAEGSVLDAEVSASGSSADGATEVDPASTMGAPDRRSDGDLGIGSLRGGTNL
jgi:ferritin-like protein